MNLKIEDIVFGIGGLFLVVTTAYVLVAEGAFAVETGRAAARGIALLAFVVAGLIRFGRWVERRSHVNQGSVGDGR